MSKIKTKIFVAICFVFLMGITSFGQELTNEIAVTIKSANIHRLEKLISQGSVNACLSIPKGKKYGYLAMSIKLKSMRSLQFFVQNGADVELVCADKTPLMYAAKYGQLEMVKYLLEQGADPNVFYRGKRAFNYARQYHHFAIAKYLKTQRLN
ncbi:MAG: ankyrin repeat domain-containing protein [Flavobacteriaceae bacterium]